RCPAPPTGCPSSTGEATLVPGLGPGVPRCGERPPSASTTELVPGPARDAPAMAPPAGQEEVDQAAPAARPTCHRPRDQEPGPAPRQGEPPLGLPPDPG